MPDDDKPAQDARIRDHFWPQRRQPGPADIQATQQLRDELGRRATQIEIDQRQRQRERQASEWGDRFTRRLAQIFGAAVAVLLCLHLLARCMGGA